MGKAKLEVPFSEITGRLDRESEIYYATRLGETVVSHYPKHKDPKKITAKQRTQQSAFQKAVAQTETELSNPQRKAYWLTKFNEQKRTAKEPYKLLRNYIIAELTKQNTFNQEK